MATIPSSGAQLNFQGLNNFHPWYTAKEMLELGVFGGAFFFNHDSRKNLPNDAFVGIPAFRYKNYTIISGNNYFAIDAPNLMAGAIEVPHDVKVKHPYGWLQWYMGICLGVRDKEADEYRILQWRKDIKNLWYYIENNTYSGNTTRYTDLAFLPQMRQGLLSRGWDPIRRPSDYGLI